MAAPVFEPPEEVSVDYRARARQIAVEERVDPALFERQIDQESGFNPRAVSPAGAEGIAQIVRRWHPSVDPMDPEAALRYAARWMRELLDRYGDRYGLALAAYNAGPGAVDRYGGIPPFAETRQYVRAILGDGASPPQGAEGGSEATSRHPRFDPETPAVLQPNDWSCSIASTQWLLRSIGRQPSWDWLVAMMVPGLVDDREGLHRGDGQTLARFIQEQYGYPAGNLGEVGWDDVRGRAGTTPLALGGRRWGDGGHWTGLRGYDSRADALLLANPAPGYAGVWDRLTHSQFDAFGPFALVYVEVGPAPDPVADLGPAAECDALRRKVDDLGTVVGYLTGDVADVLDGIGGLPESEARAELANVVSELRRHRL